MPIRKVNVQLAPNLNNKPAVRLVKSNFESAIWQHGYPVYHDKMIKCPCSGPVGQPLVTCRNCIGTGWVLVERIQTRMILQSINLDTKFKEWSEERVGTVKITALDKDTLSFMDRIVVIQATVLFNEILKIRKRTTSPNKFTYTVYDIIFIASIYKWSSDTTKLVKLVEGVDYTFERNRITLSAAYDNVDDIRLTIKYWHNPQFHVIDISRDVINQDVLNTSPQESGIISEKFPISATGRRSHYVIDAENYAGDLILDNSNGLLEAGPPVVLIPANPSYNPLSYLTLYINLTQMQTELSALQQEIINLVGVEGTYIFQDIDESSPYNYVGYLKSTGEWFLKRLQDLGGGDLTILYANISNNPTYLTYSLAWTNRINLSYTTIEYLTF